MKFLEQTYSPKWMKPFYFSYLMTFSVSPFRTSFCSSIQFVLCNTSGLQDVMNIGASWSNYRVEVHILIFLFFLYRRNARHLGEDEDPLTQCVRQGGEEPIYLEPYSPTLYIQCMICLQDR